VVKDFRGTYSEYKDEKEKNDEREKQDKKNGNEIAALRSQ